uniref:Uncharacterized protein n=1 Tax=viral metagenome TaxID=1070528 RepID=A0A6C0BU96_9ZZZZ
MKKRVSLKVRTGGKKKDKSKIKTKKKGVIPKHPTPLHRLSLGGTRRRRLYKRKTVKHTYSQLPSPIGRRRRKSKK